MSETRSDAVDRSTAEAWQEFEGRLTTYAREMAPGAVLTLDAPGGEEPEGGCRPWVQVMRGETAVLVCVPGNEHLTATLALTDAQAELLAALGFEAPGSAVTVEPFVEEESSVWVCDHPDPCDAGEVACAVVAALRDVFGVIDPAFLEIDGDGDGGAWMRLVMSEPGPLAPVLRPSSPTDLAMMLGPALQSFLEEEVHVDDDGDHWFDHGGAIVYVTARHERPMFEVFTRLLQDVRSRRQTALELAVLNRTRLPKFVLTDRAVFLTMLVSASPFSAEHLEAVLPVFLATIDDTLDDLALRTGGRR